MHIITRVSLWTLLVCALIGLVSAIGAVNRDGSSGTTVTTTSDQDFRQTLCRSQEKLLDHYIEIGDVDKMREYQRYLTENKCYG